MLLFKIKKIFLVVGIMLLTGLFLACGNQQGTAEKVGKNIDEQVQKARNAIDTAVNDVKSSLNLDKGPMQKTGEKIDQIAQNAKEKLNQVAQEAKNNGTKTAQNVSQQIDQIVKNTRKQLENLVQSEE